MRIHFFREGTLESSSMPHSIAAGKTIPTASPAVSLPPAAPRNKSDHGRSARAPKVTHQRHQCEHRRPASRNRRHRRTECAGPEDAYRKPAKCTAHQREHGRAAP